MVHGEFEMMCETLETLLATGTLTSQRIVEHLKHEAQFLKGCTEEKQAQYAAFCHENCDQSGSHTKRNV